MKTKLSPAEKILAWGREQGVIQDRPDDVRFVAHEIFHALDVSISAPWGSDEIHDRIMEHRDGQVAAFEVRARAGEWLVCHSLGIEYDVSHWTLVAAMEAKHSGLNLFRIMRPDVIQKTAGFIDVQLIVQQILRAGGKRGPRLKKLPKVDA